MKRWICTAFVGSAKWQGTEVYEPAECGAETVTDDDAVTAICSGCGGEMHEEYDSPEVYEKIRLPSA